MQFLTVSVAFALFAALGSAIPAKLGARNCWVSVTFEGATPEAQFTQSVPTDSEFTVYNDLSISHIQVGTPYSGCTTECTFYGIDGSVTETYGAGFSDVGPPQTQTSGYCTAIY
ncbi:MAG: hypothetical protein MMC33_000857 [Icmadophila ericetorum]|nr:hypothetical protein [Icmadophila ericetorum]